MEYITLQASGMSCGHCVKAIEDSVGELPGVSKVKVHLESGKVEVEYDPASVTLNKIKAAIDEQGYDVL
ncbi:copper chaperone CopZ [Bacillus mesophilum]|uniref:Copper chaperone CopZ n=1 Tax=Bacillus mesophilum TaxID=1071718 RepID=A0A7V7UW25_9BACI|nr:copper chaperone CopZ [Bacillus mesophilum]KAB2333504.1 copper chaperone CopZ [Bacillus mesophilum]